MAFLQQLRQLFTKSSLPARDPSFGLLTTLGIEELLRQQNWEQLESVAASLAPDDLTRLLDGLCLTDAHAQALASYQQVGTSDLRHLVAGVHATHVAWQIRGGAYAKYLGQQQIEGFQNHLGEAQQHLAQVSGPATYRAEAAARTVRVAMGLSEPEQAQQAFWRCQELVPDHLQAHLFYFNLLTPKWFGSEDALEDLVADASTPALHQLLEAMHLVELFQIHTDSSAAVQQQFRSHSAQRLTHLLTQSSPLTDNSLYAIYFNNYLACLYHLVKQTARRDEFLRVLGRAITPYPWAYFGLEPADVSKLTG